MSVLSSNLGFVSTSVLRITHLSMLWRYIGRYSVKSAVNLSIKVWFTICLATVLQLILKDTCMLSHMHAMRNLIWTQIFSWDLAPDLILNLLSHSIPSHFPAETMHWAITYNQWKGYIKDTQVFGKQWRKHISKCYSVLAVGLTDTLPTYPGNLEACQSERQPEQTDRASHMEQFEVLLDCKINPKLSYEGYRRWL